jgi:folate-dependent tRNA-U54 methylase TrmFO/GidA
MNANFGLLDPPDAPVKKAERKAAQVARARRDFAAWLPTT